MPWNGRNSFLHIQHKMITFTPMGVNALKRAKFISTEITDSSEFWDAIVSMPWIGRSSFLPLYGVSDGIPYVVSMPWIGRSSFLQGRVPADGLVQGVSMPWIGRSSFLHSSPKKKEVVSLVCQCPESGEVHFYVRYDTRPGLRTRGVNALNRAKFISTNTGFGDFLKIYGVNALNRAKFIST